MAKRIVYAPVQRWNSDAVRVKCPYCTSIHTHSFNGFDKGFHRTAHCENSHRMRFPYYHLAYPFSVEGGTTTYEIDKTNGFYVTLGAEPEPKTAIIEEAMGTLSLDGTDDSDDDGDDPDDSDDLARGGDMRPKLADATETTTIIIVGEDETDPGLRKALKGAETFELKRIEHVISQMLLDGDYVCVEDYLRTSHEAELFLSGVDDSGKSILNLASCERFPDIVELLLKYGADPNSRDDKSRTPLMEAALWGRVENVEHLLQHGADKTLRDAEHQRAIDLANQHKRNERERYWRSGGHVQVYRENTYEANDARRVIVELLKDAEPSSGASAAPDPVFQMHSFHKSDKFTVQLVAPVASFPLSSEWKTIASLQRSPPFPPIAAMSGWSHGENITTVSGADWTEEVRRLSRIIGHRLGDGGNRDRGTEGRYFASHAEKQLIAYFISKHVLFPRGESELLQLAKPPVVMSGATVLVSRPPCGDCSAFIRRVNSVLGLDIVVLDRSEGWEKGSETSPNSHRVA